MGVIANLLAQGPEFVSELGESEVKGLSNRGAGLVGTQVSQAVAGQMEGELDDVNWESAFFEVGVEFNFGAGDGGEMLPKSANFLDGVVTQSWI